MRRGLIVHFLMMSLGLVVALMTGVAQADNDYYDNVTGGAGARQLAPRVAMQNAEFELVAVAQGRKLVIYLDRFDDGTPIENAQIDVGTGDEILRASPVKSGLYVVTADWIATPGRRDLTFATQTGLGSATLAATLVIPAAKAETGEAARDDDGDNNSAPSASPLMISLPIEAVLGIGLGVLAAVGFSALAVLRRAPSREAAPQQVTPAGERRFAAFALARPVRRIAATLAVLLVVAVLLLGSGMFGRKNGGQHAMSGGVVGLVR